MTTTVVSPRLLTWRTPLVIIVCGCLISALTFGPRSALGFFLKPLSIENGWGRDVFALALAFQNLLWGIGQPIAGAVADRFGAVRVLCLGLVIYAIGLGLMGYATTPLQLNLTAGVLIGLGLSGCSFNLVLSAVGKLLPDGWRLLGFGAVTAASSFGQFLFSPLAVALIDQIGWPQTLVVFAGMLVLLLPMTLALVTPRALSIKDGAAAPQSFKQALREAFAYRSYLLLVLGFFTCGFQLAFITVHMPAYLLDRGLSSAVGGWTLAVIGLFNIVGSLGAGWLASRMPKRYLLAAIYFARAAAITAFVSLPVTPFSAILFGAVMGLLWLSTVPPTNGLVVLMFGTRWLAMLAGVAFFSHQVGGFLGVWLGGIAFERTGSYDLIWWLSVLFGVLSALLNLPIREGPAARLAPA